MAKGFKVIPKETPKKDEWDYEKIKQRVKGKQIVFCLRVLLIRCNHKMM